jgi:archaellum component FlaG (FlaF/FlaG flagellin family)
LFKGKAILVEAMRKAEVELPAAAAGAVQTSTQTLEPSVNDADQMIQTSMKSDDFGIHSVKQNLNQWRVLL